MWEMKVPVLSTGHLKEKTAQEWTANQHSAAFLKAEYAEGFFVYVSAGGFDCLEDSTFYKLCVQHGWTELLPILHWLHKTYPGEGEVTWIRFDADGDVVPELETFDW